MSKNKPLISVVIPIFNDGIPLMTLLESFLKSTDYDLQIICIDDQSTDDSYSLVAKRANLDKRIELYQTTKNSGAAAARNLGLSKARGNFVCFIDADDEIKPTFFSSLLLGTRDDVALVSTGLLEKYLKLGVEDYKFCSATPQRKKGETIRHYAIRNLVQSGELYSAVTKIYRNDVIQKNKIRFDEGMNFGEDTKFVLQYLGHFSDRFKIQFIAKPLYIYNYGTKTSTVSKSALRWQNWLKSYLSIKKWYLEKEKLKKILFKKLFIRYRLSHSFAVERSNLSLLKKLKYASFFEILVAKLLLMLKK